jgi:replication factor A1
MSFWNDDIDKIQAGMTIKIENGYCSEFKGEKQLTTGKFGKFMVL